MKKFGLVFSLLVFFIGGCALAPQKAIMTQMDLSLLKGKWQGSRDIYFDKKRAIDFTEMEIFNDFIPLKGKISTYGQEGADIRNYSFENGFIDAGGDLSIQLTEINKITLFMYREGEKIKLDGYYTHRDNRGRLTLYKK